MVLLLSKQWPKEKKMAVREGFEPSIRDKPYTPLAGERLQPLGHLTSILKQLCLLLFVLYLLFGVTCAQRAKLFKQIKLLFFVLYLL